MLQPHHAPGHTRIPLNVVVITHYFPAHGGGIEKVAEALALKMSAHKLARIIWFASDCDAAPLARTGLEARPVPAWNGIEVRSGLPYPVWSPAAWTSLWLAIRQADLVHVHDYVYSGSMIGWAMAALAGRPCIHTQHVGNVALRSRVLSTVLKLVNASVGRVVLRTSAATVFVSDVVRRQFFRKHRNIHVIANGVDLSVFHPFDVADRAALRQRLKFPKTRPVLLFVGRFVAKKGLHLLRTLATATPDAQWVFAGRGPLDPSEWHLSNVRVYRDRAGNSLAELYRAADLLVLPSVGEGFPLVVQESLACGTPALCGSELAGALPEIEKVLMLEDVFEPGAFQRWRERLTVLLSDPASLDRRRADVARFAAEHWSWDACASAYLTLYREVLANQPRRN